MKINPVSTVTFKKFGNIFKKKHPEQIDRKKEITKSIIIEKPVPRSETDKIYEEVLQELDYMV